MARPDATAAPRSSPPAGRPRVISHNAASVDGRVALSPGVLLMFDERWPTDAGSTYEDLQRRHQPQATLEGSGSLVTDGQPPDPLPAPERPAEVLLRDFVPDEAVARATRGWFAVVDGRGRIRWAYTEMDGWQAIVLVATSTPLDYLDYLQREAIPYLVVGDEHVDLDAALRRLHSRLGVETVVATGGGRLNGALLRAGLLDEIEVEVVPIAIGGTATPTMFTAPDLAATELPVRLRLLEVAERPSGAVLLRYAVDHGGEDAAT